MNNINNRSDLSEIIKTDAEFWSFRRLITFTLILIPIATIIGNALVIIAVLRERSLHNVTNHLIVSLAFADFLIALCVMSFAVYFKVNSYIWGLGPFLCDLYMAIDVALSTASILNLLAISIDRYMAVTRPLIYVELGMRWKRPKIMIFTVWLTAGTVGLPILFGVNHHADDKCEFTNALFIIISSLLSFFLPCTAIVVLYTVILFRLHKRKKGNQWKYDNRRSAPSIICSSLIENARLAKQFGKHFKFDQFYVQSSAQLSSKILSPSDNVQEMEAVGMAIVGSQSVNVSNTVPKSESEENEQLLLQLSLQREKWTKVKNLSFGEHLHNYLPYIDSTNEHISRSSKLRWDGMEENNFEDTKTSGNWLERKCFSPFDPQNTFNTLKVCNNNTISNLTSEQDIEMMKCGTSLQLDNPKRLLIKKAIHRLRRERKATDFTSDEILTKISLLMECSISVVFLCCWLPFFTLHMINAACIFQMAKNCIHFDTFFFTTWLGYFNSSLNPMIYTAFDKRFRKAFRRILLSNSGNC